MEQRLSWLKTVLGIEDTQRDGLLEFVLQAVEERVLSYIRHDALPRELERLTVLMAASYWREGNLGEDQAAVGRLTAVSRGDVSMDFAAAEAGAFDLGGRDCFFGWRSTLDGYRRLKRRDGGR